MLWSYPIWLCISQMFMLKDVRQIANSSLTSSILCMVTKLPISFSMLINKDMELMLIMWEMKSLICFQNLQMHYLKSISHPDSEEEWLTYWRRSQLQWRSRSQDKHLNHLISSKDSEVRMEESQMCQCLKSTHKLKILQTAQRRSSQNCWRNIKIKSDVWLLKFH